jgi:hypothetical protein
MNSFERPPRLFRSNNSIYLNCDMHEIATSLSALCEKSASSYASLIDCSARERGLGRVFLKVGRSAQIALAISPNYRAILSAREIPVSESRNSLVWSINSLTTTHSRMYVHTASVYTRMRRAGSRASPFHASLCVCIWPLLL